MKENYWGSRDHKRREVDSKESHVIANLSCTYFKELIFIASEKSQEILKSSGSYPQMILMLQLTINLAGSIKRQTV
jgi:hypothetical protein